MKRVSLVALLALGVLAMWTSDAVACKNCGCSAKQAAACSSKTSCPLQAALTKANLTAEQKKKVDILLAECKAACKKASETCCPRTQASLRAKALKDLQTKLSALLTADQKKIVEPVFAKLGTCGRKAGSCSKAGCGK